jgi:hypothetical protein
LPSAAPFANGAPFAATARPAITLLLIFLVLASALAVGFAEVVLENSDFFSIAIVDFS